MKHIDPHCPMHDANSRQPRCLGCGMKHDERLMLVTAHDAPRPDGTIPLALALHLDGKTFFGVFIRTPRELIETTPDRISSGGQLTLMDYIFECRRALRAGDTARALGLALSYGIWSLHSAGVVEDALVGDYPLLQVAILPERPDGSVDSVFGLRFLSAESMRHNVALEQATLQ